MSRGLLREREKSEKKQEIRKMKKRHWTKKRKEQRDKK